ncbi:MAG: Mut7-C RNAse domain-containing protein [Gammaproteobacteria bacterium]|nr:Mut7-C RNAse domain-containing protein [Gammaproteobacteria bacterium]MDH5651064.1 Mut7-C RNAse domain-containing protein [Gammaproteobacteria bacterium]
MAETELPKILCDEMLQRLGRWLRAAGYDTVIAGEAEADYELLQRARREGRYLITRDQGMLSYRNAADHVILLTADSLDTCAESLTEKLHINWLAKPFTRCMVCNTELIDATPQQIAGLSLVKEGHIDAAFYCPNCRQVFWDGSHVKRMRTHLYDWASRFSGIEISVVPNG